MANGYSLADICRFYAHTRDYKNDVLRRGRTDQQALDEAFERFVHHGIYFGGTVIDAAPEIVQQAAAAEGDTEKTSKS